MIVAEKVKAEKGLDHSPRLWEEYQRLLPRRHTYPCTSRPKLIRKATGLKVKVWMSDRTSCWRCMMEHLARYVFTGKRNVTGEVTWHTLELVAKTDHDREQKARKLRRQAEGKINGFTARCGERVVYFIHPEQKWRQRPGLRSVFGVELARLMHDVTRPDGRRSANLERKGKHRIQPLGGWNNASEVHYYNGDNGSPPAFEFASGDDFPLEDRIYHRELEEVIVKTNELEEEAAVRELRQEEDSRELTEEEERLVRDVSWTLEVPDLHLTDESLDLAIELSRPTEVFSSDNRFLGYFFDRVAEAKYALILDALGAYHEKMQAVHNAVMRLSPLERHLLMSDEALGIASMIADAKRTFGELADQLRERFGRGQHRRVWHARRDPAEFVSEAMEIVRKGRG